MKNRSIRIGLPDTALIGPKVEALPTSLRRLEALPLVLTFDVEEHHRIESASGLDVHASLKDDYGRRMVRMTEWLLEQLAEHNVRATFFVVGEIAVDHPRLVRAIHGAGHEVASHGWNHRRILVMTPDVFRQDVRQSRDALEQVCGTAVVGYRAPTFSLVRRTAWALDVLAELGLLYDSSIYPVRHDRYGIPDAPREPFIAGGAHHELLEIPPATLRIGGVNIPIGGGGYFRLLPLALMELALGFARRDRQSGATALYFHPWEFDADQPRLPLTGLNRFRTYVGIRHTQERFLRLLGGYRFTRAVDLARQLQRFPEQLRRFELTRHGSS